MNIHAQELLNSFFQETDTLRQSRIVLQLRREHELSIKEIATHIKKHPTFVSHMLRVVRLPELVQDGYYADQLSFAHLIILSRLESKEDILKAYEVILSKALSTAQTEELVRELKFRVKSTSTLLSPRQIELFSSAVKKQFPTAECRIYQSHIRGKLVVEWRGDPTATGTAIEEAIRGMTRQTHLQEALDADELMVLE